jgi:hypothetical protein
MKTGPDLAALAALDLAGLRTAWNARFREPASAFRTKDLLLRAFVYKLESRRHGGLSISLSRRLEELAQSYLSDPDFQPAPKPSLTPGTRLSREWNGVAHVVEVTDTGFVYQGKTYRSLSVVARTITGVHRSGPHFFGVSRSVEPAR